ncbi:hypothetical protein [Trueperella pyogenes]|uniref:hypothetical protein n=1 Tax=Trueperella pyogenes TaxID=1661 RepID=UPI00043B0DAA|nr:hypothetical protein [Trueperella pyogenes]AHU90394.1 hypothetical protein CQ11_01410 [Trueperella pyogenes]AWA42783.1 hypothetical protein DBV13_01405 [Trueperella pyogenes]AZR03302.1 hypothetical protein EB775_08320 [Trueperella pyogenes]WHU59275.1 hypothetical protein QEV21_01200 [Trueperella pyogenes]
MNHDLADRFLRYQFRTALAFGCSITHAAAFAASGVDRLDDYLAEFPQAPEGPTDLDVLVYCLNWTPPRRRRITARLARLFK